MSFKYKVCKKCGRKFIDCGDGYDECIPCSAKSVNCYLEIVEAKK
jgi:hypothetical protein